MRRLRRGRGHDAPPHVGIGQTLGAHRDQASEIAVRRIAAAAPFHGAEFADGLAANGTRKGFSGGQNALPRTGEKDWCSTIDLI